MPKKMEREEAIKYLEGIDKRLHYIETNTSPGIYHGCTRDAYHDDQKMDKKEIKKVLKIVKDYELPMAPINTDFGFSVGFKIYDASDKGIMHDVKGECLVFTEKQLPKGYDFKALSKVFLRQKNIELLKWFGLDEKHDIDKFMK